MSDTPQYTPDDHVLVIHAMQVFITPREQLFKTLEKRGIITQETKSEHRPHFQTTVFSEGDKTSLFNDILSMERVDEGVMTHDPYMDYFDRLRVPRLGVLDLLERTDRDISIPLMEMQRTLYLTIEKLEQEPALHRPTNKTSLRRTILATQEMCNNITEKVDACLGKEKDRSMSDPASDIPEHSVIVSFKDAGRDEVQLVVPRDYLLDVLRNHGCNPASLDRDVLYKSGDTRGLCHDLNQNNAGIHTIPLKDRLKFDHLEFIGTVGVFTERTDRDPPLPKQKPKGLER